MTTNNDDNSTPAAPPIEAELDAQMARIDGINGSAGHRLEDPYLRDLLRKQLAGEITAERYRELGMEHLRKQAAE